MLKKGIGSKKTSFPVPNLLWELHVTNIFLFSRTLIYKVSISKSTQQFPKEIMRDACQMLVEYSTYVRVLPVFIYSGTSPVENNWWFVFLVLLLLPLWFHLEILFIDLTFLFLCVYILISYLPLPFQSFSPIASCLYLAQLTTQIIIEHWLLTQISICLTHLGYCVACNPSQFMTLNYFWNFCVISG